jgi:hypothetical protein
MPAIKRAAWGGKYITRAILAHHCGPLRPWSYLHQVPDPADYADIADLASEFAWLWVQGDGHPEKALAFSYPKALGDRRLSLISPRDNVRLRAAAGAVLEMADTVLNPKAVFSARAGTKLPYWTFQTHGYKKFQDAAKREIRDWTFGRMTRSDISNYFGSIPLEKLLQVLWDAECDRESVIFLLQTMLAWADAPGGAPGLAIGPEASAIMGSFFLHPVDTAMSEMVGVRFRYMDDTADFYPSTIDGATWERDNDESLVQAPPTELS